MPETTNTPELTTLVGSYEAALLRDIYTGFTVFLLKTKDAVEKQNKQGCVRVCGVIPDYAIGTPLSVTGTWENAKYGPRLRIASIEETSMNRHLLVSYLASGMFPGVGMAAALKLAEAFGEDFFRVAASKNAFERISGQVPELKPKAVRNMIAVLNQGVAFKSLFDFILAHGGTYSSAKKLFSLYGDRALENLKKHPYQCGMAVGIKFAVCDQIALECGFSCGDGERLRAILRTALSLNGNGGHTYSTWAQVVKTAKRVQKDNAFHVDIPSPILLAGASRNESLTIEGENGEIIRRTGLSASIESVREDKVYLTKLYDAEVRVAKEISRLAASSKPLPFTKELLKEAEAESGLEYAPEQRAAFDLLSKTGVGVLTGGPGTGKTTVICGILNAYRKMVPTGTIQLAAPTGRAAQRMAESTGCEAITIHRLLEYVPYSDEPKKNASNPLTGDFIVIDESSMIDIELAAMLLGAIKNGALVLFVGDVNQLPAVGAGDVLHDLIGSNCIQVAQLKAVFRQKGTSPIVANAYNINNGIFKLEEAEDFVVTKTDDVQAEVEKIVNSDWNPDDPYSLQILCPTHRGDGGEFAINEKLQALLNPRNDAKPEIRYSKRIFRVGDKVLLTKNNYDEQNGYYNGDIGVIKSVSPMVIDISGREVKLSTEQIGDCSLAYAMTVHKSQGSEFATTVVVLTEDSPSMLKRNLLYTAVTRAKKKLVIVYSGDALNTSIKNGQTAVRNTRLCDRLKKEFSAEE